MNIQLKDNGAFSSVLVRLQPGEQFVSESGAMFRADSNIDIDVTTRTRGGGGLLAAAKRMLAKESFFLSTYTCQGPQPGEVGLAPTLVGEIAVIDCDGSCQWICAGGSYLGSSPELTLDTQFQGIRGAFTGESWSFLKVSGRGQLLVTAFGHLTEVEVEGELVVDTGHAVAFQDTLRYSVSKAGTSWIQSTAAGEGIVLRFTGTGRLYVQSHNPPGFGKTLGPLLPERS